MKICVISSTVFKVPVVGYAGLEHLAWQQAKGLAERGHQVTLIAPDGSSCPGVTVVPTGPPGRWGEKESYGGFTYATGVKIKNEKGEEADQTVTVPPYWPELLKHQIIADHSWSKFSSLLKMEGRLKAPILGVMHAPVNTMYQTLPPEKIISFVCISNDQADHFRALFNRECRVVYNGIDTDWYKPIEGIKRSDRFLFLARFSRIKGPDLAIDVCRATNSNLDMVGDTQITGEPDYLEFCKKKTDGKQIKFVGPANRGEAVWWYSQARGFIHLCPQFREPYGLAPVEAQACQNPVLCFNYGAMRETVKDKETGFLVKSIEQAVEIMKSGAMDSIDREACRENAQRFTVEKMIDNYEKLCFEAVDSPW